MLLSQLNIFLLADVRLILSTHNIFFDRAIILVERCTLVIEALRGRRCGEGWSLDVCVQAIPVGRELRLHGVDACSLFPSFN